MNKKLIAALSIPGLVLGGAAVAGAQTTDTDVDTPTDDSTSEAREQHRDRRGHGPVRGFATALGLDGAELRAGIEGGSTIAEIAKANGVDIDGVIAEMVAGASERAAANPDSKRAQNFDADALTERLTAAANGEVDLSQQQGRQGPGFGDTVAEALGLDNIEIREALRGGSTIADLAAQQGVDLGSIVDQIVADAQARADANPDSRLAQNFDAETFVARVTDRLNGEGDQGRRGQGQRGQGRPGGVPAGAPGDASA